MQSEITSKKGLHLPDNIKVHFAGAEVMPQFIACKELGVNYALYTAFPFVERMVFGVGKSPIMPLRWMTNPAIEIPTFINQSCRHTIQDSGLFTLLFGSRKNTKVDEALIDKWYDNLVQFTLDHGQPVTCVEVDCQGLVGMKKVWELRERMSRDLPNNRIIHVFHVDDGQYELDKLIEYSDYIGYSAPQFLRTGSSNYISKIARYIKNKKPFADIHLLGCTAQKLLRENSFCTSCDSTTYTAPKRYGFLAGKHIRNLSTERIIEYFGKELFELVMEYNNEQNTRTMLLSIKDCMNKYQEYCGNQDYKNHK